MKKVLNHTVVKYVLESLAILIFAFSISVLCVLLMRGIRFSEEQSGVVADMISGVIAAIAAGLVLIELKASERERARQNDIEEASFLLQYNQSFIQDPNLVEVQSLLERAAFYGKTDEIISSRTRQKFVNYLVYLEGLSPLILHGILNLDHIDNLMAYRFFLAVNNREVQDKEIKKFPEYYRGCFRLYKLWSAYRKQRSLVIPFEETALDLWEDFSKHAD